MTYNLKGFLKFTYLAIIKGLKPYKITFKWVLMVIYFYLLYPIWQLIVWIGLGLDRVLFPKYLKTEIKEPIFIIGNPRSGTTFLHRMMARDKENFTSIKTWEIFASPSIVGRYIFKNLANVDRLIGSPIIKLIQKFDLYLQSNAYSRLHSSPIWEPEEDDNLFLHIWSSIKVWLAVGLVRNAFQYVYFDQKMPLKDKKRIFKFYKACLKRHIYFHKAQNKHYLSKSPYFSSKIETILETFPDAKIIYMVRNPVEMVPSYLKMLNTAWNAFDEKDNYKRKKGQVLRMAKHWYEYPLEKLETLPNDKYIMVKLEDLAKNPQSTLEIIYENFNLGMSADFAETVAKMTKINKNSQKVNKYNLKRFGLKKKMFFPRFKRVFKRFGFQK